VQGNPQRFRWAAGVDTVCALTSNPSYEPREFDLYLHDYRRPRTVYELPRLQAIEWEVIAELDGRVVSVEFDRHLFFLPFQTSDMNWPAAPSVAKMVAGAIVLYRCSRVSDILDWFDELRFKSEDLYLKINSLLEQVNRLDSPVGSWKNYHGILKTYQWRNRILAILECVFDFHVKLEADRKSAMITQDNHRPIFIFQSYITDKDIGRDFTDQIHMHRESKGCSNSLNAILFVNSDMASNNIRVRAEKEVADDIVRRGRTKRRHRPHDWSFFSHSSVGEGFGEKEKAHAVVSFARRLAKD